MDRKLLHGLGTYRLEKQTKCQINDNYIDLMITYTYDPHHREIGSLSTHVFETRTATGSELFSLLTCFHTTTFTLLSIFSPLEMISTKIWQTPLSWHVKCSLPVVVRISKTRVLKLPNDDVGFCQKQMSANESKLELRNYISIY